MSCLKLIVLAVFGCALLKITATEEVTPEKYNMLRERLDNQTAVFEKTLKDLIKSNIKRIMPTVMKFASNSPLSAKCMRGFLKYVSGLQTIKVWAMKMLDATSKPPAGLFEGTLSDFGAFDECLDVVYPMRNGSVDFRGQYCAIEASPILPPVPKNFTLAKIPHADIMDTIGEELKIAGITFHYLKLRFGVCVPSSCSHQDMKFLASKIAETIQMNVEVPRCYVKEETKLTTLNIVVLCILVFLLILAIYGTFIDYKMKKIPESDKSLVQKMFACFSLARNYNHLFNISKNSHELKPFHGLRALSMAYVMFGHTYVWTNFQLNRRPYQAEIWFNRIELGFIFNGWLGVESFFFLSGFLTSYTILQIMPKTKGKINFFLYFARRYLRLTPPLLLTIGLAFFMPVISSGPFWYEKIDPELKSCTNYWWTSLLYFSNWTGLNKICVHPTWYLSADFQLYAVSFIILHLLYWFPKIAILFISVLIIACCISVGIVTYLWDLPPFILVSSGNQKKILETLDIVHIQTFAHAGPYFIGIILGFIIIRHQNINISKVTNISCWCSSFVLCVLSLYGGYKWTIGEAHGTFLTCLYAAVHRTTFTLGIAWIIYACIKGCGGFVNKILSLPIFIPISRLTYMIYLLHSLVIWVRLASMRERTVLTHYNIIYEYVGNVIFTITLAIPCYLLLEAPISNLERLIFSKLPQWKKETATGNGVLPETASNQPIQKIAKSPPEILISNAVELTGVKNIRMEVGYYDNIISERNSNNRIL